MDNLELSLAETLDTADLKDVTKDVIEAGIDSFLKDGILRDIPIVKTLVAIFNLGVSVKDRLFMKKLLSFLYEIKDTQAKDRQRVISQIDLNKDYRKKVGENLLMMIDRFDTLAKASIAGKLFKAVLEQRIQYKIYQRICFSIDRAYIDDIAELRKLQSGESISYETKNALFISGLMKRTSMGDLMISGDNEFEINELGKILVREIYGKQNVQY